MVTCENLSAGYNGDKIIEKISLDFKEGEVLVILGPNGCGKSTLLRAVLGIIKPMEGDVLYDGVSIAELSEREIAKKAAFLTQSRDTPNIRADRLVLHGRFPWLGFPRKYTKKDYDIAREAMEQTDCLEIADQFLPTLSGGQKQKVYLAMTVAQQTPMVFMDEPTTYLDINNQLQMIKSGRKMAKEGKAVVMILHDIPMALCYADKIAVMNEGRLLMTGSPEEIVGSEILNKVFNIRLQQVETPEGKRFFCE